MGGPSKPNKQMDDFRKALMDWDLGDLGFEGSQYTWCNNRDGSEFTKERLDRALVNGAWQHLYDTNSVITLPVQCSDHNPIMIASKIFAHFQNLIKRIFRYEVAWDKKEGCEEIIKRAWQGSLKDGTKADVTRRGLERCRFQLRQWNHESRRKSQQD
ncbi:uncharacterized protein LOC121265729 [Juglans microcarpa x Juglans regia]|uniref:uncharacterized protein LOC121265729 n=1 Tax=Juglans microcarpa x Juglans regia TaxID=2249226 RepID=UPI001B7EF468|nr:uncharacterized protein LOC121265729 [Juglans microcarpa x Juglans regia]